MLKRQMYSYCGFANMLRSCLSFSIKLNSVFTTPRKYFLAGYKSQYNVESLYPGSNLNFNLQPLQKYTQQNENEFSGYIPMDELSITYSKARGPGGQNVNKVNTKVEVRFHVESAEWIPQWIRNNILEKERNSITKDGYYVVTSDKTRKQMLNQADCMDKVRYMIRQAAVKPYEPTESEIEVMHKRKAKARKGILREKRMHSLKKQNRGPAAM